MYSPASVWETFFLYSVQTPAMHTAGETTPSVASSEQLGQILVLSFVTQSCG
jgi:hypothetical protein